MPFPVAGEVTGAQEGRPICISIKTIPKPSYNGGLNIIPELRKGSQEAKETFFEAYVAARYFFPLTSSGS